MSKFQTWFKKKVNKGMEIHSSIANLKRFKWINKGARFGCFLIFIVAIVLFYFFGLTYKMNDVTESWYIWPTHHSVGKWLCFAFGLLLFLGALVFGVLVCGLYFPIMFKESQALYMQTDEYKRKVAQYENEDLSKYILYDLKWLKKAKYISKFTYNVELTKRKQHIAEALKGKKHEKK